MDLVQLVNSTECELLSFLSIPTDVYDVIEDACTNTQVCAEEQVTLMDLVAECSEKLGGAVSSLNVSGICPAPCRSALDVATNSSCEAAIRSSLGEPSSQNDVYTWVRDAVGTACASTCLELAEQVVEKGDACISEMPTVNISGIGEVPAGGCSASCMDLVQLVNSTECELLSFLSIPTDVYDVIEDACTTQQVCVQEQITLMDLTADCTEKVGGAISSLNVSGLCPPSCVSALDILSNTSCEASIRATSGAEAGSGSGENIYAQARDTVGTMCGTKCVELAEQVVEKGVECLDSLNSSGVTLAGVTIPAGGCSASCEEVVSLVNSTECELLSSVLPIPQEVFDVVEEVCHAQKVCAEEMVTLTDLASQCTEELLSGGTLECPDTCSSALDMVTNSKCVGNITGAVDTTNPEDLYAQVRDTVGAACNSTCLTLGEQALEKSEAWHTSRGSSSGS
jgi:hypothetical protein